MYVCMYVCWPVMYVCSMVVDRWGGVGRQTGRSARAKKKKKKSVVGYKRLQWCCVKAMIR